MPDSSRYPNLVDRALRYLRERGEADEGELCAHLFGVRWSAITGGPWSRLLRQCLGDDPRFEARGSGRWALRDRQRGALADLEFVSLAILTDGPKPWRHRIVGIAALRVAPEKPGAEQPINLVVGHWSSAIRPDRALRLPSYLRSAGLGPEELETAPTFDEVAPDLLAFLGDRPLIGLDVGLTAAFLQFALRRLGRPSIANPLVDLAALADLTLASAARDAKPTLAGLAQSLGLPVGDETRLLSRARVAADVGRRLLARAESQGLLTLGDLLGALARTSTTPSTGLDATRRRLLLDVQAAKALPAGPGVYLLKDESEQVLYVGKAANIRDRLASYLTTDLARSRRMSGLVDAATAVEARPTETELEAQLLEARLIARLRPRFNVQRRPGLRLVYLRRNLDAAAPLPLGSSRRSSWASTVQAPEREDVGPLAAAEARRLLGEARARFRLNARRPGPDWVARAERAWSWLRDEAERSRLTESLLSADLSLLAVVARWPAAQGSGSASPATSLDADPGSEPCGHLETEGGERGPIVEGSPEGAGSEPLTALRVVLLGRSGWLGSITVTAQASEVEVAAQLRLAATAEVEPNPSAPAELSVALRWLQRSPEAATPLRDPDDGARTLLDLLRRPAAGSTA